MEQQLIKAAQPAVKMAYIATRGALANKRIAHIARVMAFELAIHSALMITKPAFRVI